jgi:hypothetical protein
MWRDRQHMSVNELKLEVLKNCDVLQAVLTFNYSLTKKVKSDLETIRSLTPNAHAKWLRDRRDELRANLKRVTKEFGCLVDPTPLAAGLILSCRNGGIATVSKASIESELFSNFCAGHPGWKTLPPHIRLQVHFDWVVREPIIFHFQLPEAMLYEDMALAYNLAHETKARASQISVPGGHIDVKKHHLHLRTALPSAFYFVEAYLNGVAYVFYYKYKGTIPIKERDFLLEWDSQRDKRSLVSFEKKINEYPKIILKCQHPPLTTSNCECLKVLLSDGKEMRDSVVHQSSKTLDLTDVPEKVKWLLNVQFDSVTRVVDAAVGFTNELNALLGKEGLPLDWLYSRDSQTGRFPPESFA